MCWQLTLSVSQIIAAAINKGVENNQTTFAYRFPIGFQLLFPLLVVAFIWWVPESPRHLIRKGRPEKAAQSLRRIFHNDKSYDPTETVSVLRADVDREIETAQESSWLQLITDPIERRKVIYSAGALVAQQINGIQWFYYFGTVFAQAIGLEDPFLMTLIVFIIQVFVVLAAVMLANKLPRRPLLMITTSIMTVSIFVVGCLGIPGGTPSPTIGKVIIAFVIIEIVAFNFAWGPLGWTIVSQPHTLYTALMAPNPLQANSLHLKASEMATGRNRTKIYALAVASFWITVWATVFTLPYLYYTADLGPKTGFVYTGLCCITWAYVWFCVGEVHGRSIEEIDGFFRDGIPARKWRDQPRVGREEEEARSNVSSSVGREEKGGCGVGEREKV